MLRDTDVMDVDVLKARLVRHDVRHQWGIGLHPRRDISQPLCITSVTAGSPAANIGLMVGDVVVEIENKPATALTSQFIEDLLSKPGQTLHMTVERQVLDDFQPFTIQDVRMRTEDHQGLQQPMHIPDRHKSDLDFYSSSRGGRLNYSDTKIITFDQEESNHLHQGLNRTSGPLSYSETGSFHQRSALPPHHFHQGYRDDQPYQDDAGVCPQSRTFKALESILSNSEMSAGVNGLPPPRSAALEKIRGQKPRIKVLMPQQYNSPMGMYSAHNVLETFTAQAESMLNANKK